MSILRKTRTFARLALALSAAHLALAQRGAGDWSTAAYDAQRSSWVRGDGKINPVSLSKPGFGLYWKLKMNNAARGLNNLTPPALIDFYIGYRGFRTLGFFGGSSDRVIAVDLDIARIEWEKSFGTRLPAPTGPCPGGMTSTVTRPTSPDYPPPFAARGAGRATPARSGVGEPMEGAVTLRRVPPPPPPPPVAPAKPAAAPAFNPFSPRIQWVLALAGDGKLHRMFISNGHEPEPGIAFLPPNAHALGLISFEDTVYAATTNGCGGVADGVWALNLGTKQVKQWKSDAGAVAGSAGPAFGPDGTVYVATKGAVIAALRPGTLEEIARYKNGAGFASSPVVFDYKGRTLLAAATVHGRIQLIDPAALRSNEFLDRSERYSANDFAAGTLTSWQDAAGVRWILAAAAGPDASKTGFRFKNGEITNGAVVAFKVVDKNGKPVLEPGWVSRDLVSPLPPVVVNGVVFALSSGEDRADARRSKPAVLYALDALDGKEIWNSSSSIASFVHSGGLSLGGGRVYVSDHQGTQYAFAFPLETLEDN